MICFTVRSDSNSNSTIWLKRPEASQSVEMRSRRTSVASSSSDGVWGGIRTSRAPCSSAPQTSATETSKETGAVCRMVSSGP